MKPSNIFNAPLASFTLFAVLAAFGLGAPAEAGDKAKPEDKAPMAAKFCPPNCPTPPLDVAPQRIAAPPTRLKRCGWVMLEKCVGQAIVTPIGFDPRASTAVVNISTSTRNDLKIIPGLSPQAITIITEEHDKGDFSSTADFGKRVCSRVSVDLSAVNAEIGGELFRGGCPASAGFKTAGFKCTAGGDGFEASGIRQPWPWYAGSNPLKL